MIKIAFFGTGEFSRNILEGLLEVSEIKTLLVVSQPDKPVGRKKKLVSTPLASLALEKGIEVLQPEKLIKNRVFFTILSDLDLDFIVVVAYGKIVPMGVLNAPKYGCINLHGSILPSYRGASPIQEALKNGDREIGFTTMYMSKGMDEGDILQIQRIELSKDDTTLDVFKKFENTGPEALFSTLKGVINGDITSQKQDDTQATYCSKISKEDGKIDFKKETSEDIYNKFRAYTPWPGVYTFYREKKLSIEECRIGETIEVEVGSVIKIDKNTIGVVCSDAKMLILSQVKLAGKKSMDIKSFVNGNRDFLDFKF